MPLREDEKEEVVAIARAEIALAMQKKKKKKVAAPVVKAATVAKPTYKREVKKNV
ncbi:MAG: hypothetical protein HN929_01535 [Chloroflexi bacterium]|jgi:hypothetical protein|nr:hypothetical protein [Chloroflexota bacterium]